MRVVFACAGTGGHINPAIAIANIILKKEPDSKILFIGTKTGLENELVTKSGFPIKHIRTGKIIRSITLKNFKAITETYRGIGDAKLILREFKPARAKEKYIIRVGDKINLNETQLNEIYEAMGFKKDKSETKMSKDSQAEAK